MAPRSDPERTELLENLKLKDYGTTEYISLTNEITKVKSTGTVKQERNGLLQLFQFANTGDKCLMITGAICAIIQGSCMPVLSVIFGSMTNTFLAQYNRGADGSNATDDISNGTREFNPALEEFGESMVLYSSYYLVIAIIAFTTAFCQTFCWELAAERQVYRLRRIFFSQLLRQDISWYDQNKDGDFSVKLSDDLERVREGLGIKFSLVVQYFSTFVSGILIGFISNWRLTALITLVGPLMLAVSTYLAKVSANSSKREQMNYAHAGSIAEEVLSNIRTVAAFCKEKIETKRYKAALEKGRKEAMRKYLIMSYGLAIVYFLMYTSYGLAFYFGAILVLNGLCTPGSIFTVFFSVMAGAFSVGNALPFINSVSIAAGAAAAIFDVIERKPYIDPYSREGLQPRSVDGYIELKQVSFKYPARPDIEVLHEMSLKIEQGRVVAFVGSSGSGKSTLIGLILRFYDPTEGYITLDGIPLWQLNVNWLRKQIGVVAQEPILFSASIADNIRYGRSNVTQEEIEEAARIANAHHFIIKLPNGYQTLAGDRGSQLSGGQKQRIAIARALVRDPKILLLDEATSALDAYSEGIVQEALEKAMCGRTTIVVAHRLSTVRNADMIYVMKNGAIREGGQHQELIDRRGLYYNLVLAQTLESRIEEPSLDRDADFEPDYRRISRSSSIASVDGTANGIECNEESLPEVSIWQLVKYNAKEWLRLTMGVLACAVTGFVMPAFSIFYSKIFEVFTLPGDQLMATAELWACMLGLLAVVSSVAMFTQTLCLTSAAEKLILRMRSKAFCNIVKQPIAWFDLPSSSTGYLVTRLARDAPLIKSAAGLRVGHVLTAMVTMTSGLIIALLYGWKLALILSICVPVIAGATCQQNRILKRHQIQDAWYVDDAGRIASECIQNIRTVQGLGNEKMFVRQYMENLMVPFKKAKKDAAYFGVVFSLSQATIYLMYAAAFRLGYYFVSNGDMVPSDIYKVFFALSFCSNAVGNTISYMQDYTRAKYAARRMMQLVNRKAEIDPTSSWGLRPDVRGNIEFANVLFTYPSRMESNVLRGISFKLAEGKSLALVGESGSGKSTVVAILERFYHPVRGSVSIDGHEISLFNLHHLRRNIGLVTQEPNLFHRSIKDNIAYGLDVNLKDAELMQEVINVSKSVNLHKFITSLPQGYETMVGDRGTQLSGGQKQRIAIARALIKNPRILLLDEATSALDTECEKIVQDALDRAREGRTCITIAHRLSTIQNADVIAVVNRGRIIEVGEHRELVARKGYYYKLTERQHI